jgi:DNA-directed RNA polymerase I subunit RPA2
MASSSGRTPTFDTLAREHSFRHPTNTGSTYPILNEFIKPHLESFNALFDDSGLPMGDGNGSGLLSLAIKDIGERVVFDGKGIVNDDGVNNRGNRMRSELME